MLLNIATRRQRNGWQRNGQCFLLCTLCPVYIEPVLRTTGAQPAHLLHLQKRLCAGLNLQGCAPTRIRAGRSTVVRRLWDGRSTIGAGCDTALSRSCDGCAPAVRRQEPVVVRLATLVPRSCYGCATVVPRSEPVDYCRLYNFVWKFDFYMLHLEKWIALTVLWKCLDGIFRPELHTIVWWELLLRDPQHFSTHCGNILLTYLLHWAHYVLLFVSGWCILHSFL